MVEPRQTTNNPVILGAIVVLGLAAGYFYYSAVLQDQIEIAPPPPVRMDDDLIKLKNLQLDFGSFDGLKLRSLKVFGESPVKPGPAGRTDIFAPF